MSSKEKGKGLFALSTLCMAIMPALFSGLVNKAHARDFFDPSFINAAGAGDSSSVPDLSIYQNKNAQAPGEYRVDIVFNGYYLTTKNVRFYVEDKSDANENVKLIPCFSLKELAEYGVRTAAFPGLKENTQGCSNFMIIPDIGVKFNFNQQRLDVSIPQAALSPIAQGYISPDEFDDGINALFANYQFSGGQEFKEDQENYSLNLQSGLNLGAWRLRNLSTWNKSSDSEGTWDSAYLYAQRSIRTINSNLVVGESSSLSSVFDSVPFTGLQLATDSSMQPESMRGYAPIVRGIAKTNARVIIKQNGYQVYQTYVAPGAFEITDMYPSGGSGDLYVTVEESDGTEQNFVVPFATLPVMLREGQFEYEVTAGKYRAYDDNVKETPFSQTTATYGISSSSTLYGGLQTASKYQAISLGIGRNLGEFGAISADVTQAWSKKKHDDKTSGQSWRIRYGKNIIETGTNITIAGYRYSTKGFHTLSEVLDTYTNKNGYSSAYSIRNRTNLTVNQSLGENLGSLSVSGLFEDYWDGHRSNKSFSLGYNNGWRNINYYVGYSYNRYTWKRNNTERESEDDHRVSLNISIPLNNWLANTYASYQLTDSKPGSTDQYVTLGGVALENDNLDWSIQQGYSNEEQNSGDVRANYHSTYGSASAGYSYNRDSSRVDYGMSGSVLVHGEGITLGQEISDAAVLVKAPGLSNVHLTTDSAIHTDSRGYAILPYVTPYRRTDVTLDTATLGDDMELLKTTNSVVPTRGAIVRSNFEGNIGFRAFIRLKTAVGKDVPYGAMVVRAEEPKSQASIVSEAGMVYLAGLQPSGILNVQWGKNANQQCQATYSLPVQDNKKAKLNQTEAICR